MRRRREEIASSKDYVESALKMGAEKARAVAEATMSEVRRSVGLR